MSRILIAEDAESIAQMLKEILEHSGFQVIGVAKNGDEAVELYKSLKPDLVTMDIIMPFKSGIAATKEILEFDPSAKIVVCSALGMNTIIEEAKEAGAKDFITKPFKASHVVSVLKKIL